MLFSLVVPVMNEEDNIRPLVDAIDKALGQYSYEIIFVDDGSSDSTVDTIRHLNDSRISVLVFSRNYGQTSAMAAGIAAAKGEYIATLDGDLQNDPSDIPMMLDVLKQNQADIVVGRRKKRQDGMILRKIPSKIANYLIRQLTDVHVKDFGCSLKLFSHDIAKKLDLYGELHRFIPILGKLHGAKIVEVDVQHHARQFGTSKYGLSRTFRVLSDLMLMLFFQKYRQKPMHLFGSLGIAMGLAGGIIETYLFACKLFGQAIGNRPLFYVGILLLITAVQLITTGFLAELIMRTYFESQGKKPYHILKRYQGNEEVNL